MRNRNLHPADRVKPGTGCPFRSWGLAARRRWQYTARPFVPYGLSPCSTASDPLIYMSSPTGLDWDYWREKMAERAADPANHLKPLIIGADFARGPDLHVETLVYAPELTITVSVREQLREVSAQIRETMPRLADGPIETIEAVFIEKRRLSSEEIVPLFKANISLTPSFIDQSASDWEA